MVLPQTHTWSLGVQEEERIYRYPQLKFQYDLNDLSMTSHENWKYLTSFFL